MSLKKMREQKDSLIGQIDAILTSMETEERSALSQEELDKVSKIKEELDRVSASIKIVEETRAKEVGKDAEVELAEKRSKEEIEERALENYLRGIELDAEEKRTIQMSNNASVMPVSIVKSIMQKLEEQCPILDQARRFSSKGTLKLISETAYGQANLTSEKAKFEDSEVTFGTIELKSYKVTAKVEVTFEMLANFEIDLTGYLMDIITKRLVVQLNKYFLVGTGTNQPQGICKAKANSVELQAKGLTVADFIKIQTAINPIYLNGAVWIVGRDTFQKMAQLLDGNGRPYLISNYDAVNNKIQYMFLGLPVVVDNNMEKLEAGKCPIVMANIGEAYAINMLQDIVVKHLTEVGFTEGFETFAGYCLVDGKLVNEDAVVITTVK